MLNKNFFQGFAEGFSKSANASITKYLDSDNQLKSKLAEKRIARGEVEESRYRKEFEEYKRDLKSLASKAGGTDNLQYLLNKFGYDGGKQKIEALYAKGLKSGVTIPSMFKLQERTGESVTIDELATFYTQPIKMGSGESMKGAGGGISKIFGGEDWIQKAVMKDTDAVVGNLTKSSLSNVPEVLTAINDLEDYEVGYSLDYTQERERLLSVAREFAKNGNMKKAHNIRIQAEANYVIADSQKAKKFTMPQLNVLENGFRDNLIEKHQIDGDYYDNGRKFKSTDKSRIQLDEANKIASEFRSQADFYVSQGIPAVDIKFALDNAIRKNKDIQFVPKDEGDFYSKPYLKLVPDSKLFKTTLNTINNNSSSSSSGKIVNKSLQNAMSNLNIAVMANNVLNQSNKSTQQSQLFLMRNTLKNSPAKLAEFENSIKGKLIN